MNTKGQVDKRTKGHEDESTRKRKKCRKGKEDKKTS